MLERSCERATFLCDPPSKIASGACIARRTLGKDSVACLTSIHSAVDSWDNALLFHLLVAITVMHSAEPHDFERPIVALMVRVSLSPTDFASLSSYQPRTNGIAEQDMGRILTRIFPAPFTSISCNFRTSFWRFSSLAVIRSNLQKRYLPVGRYVFLGALFTFSESAIGHLRVPIKVP